VNVRFAAGITDVTQQTAAGNNLLGFSAASSAANTGFAVLSSATQGGELASSQVIVFGQLSSGVPITGTATLPAGATISASVNNGAPQTINNGSFSIAANESDKRVAGSQSEREP
jgi:hypothetical protein